MRIVVVIINELKLRILYFAVYFFRSIFTGPCKKNELRYFVWKITLNIRWKRPFNVTYN